MDRRIVFGVGVVGLAGLAFAAAFVGPTHEEKPSWGGSVRSLRPLTDFPDEARRLIRACRDKGQAATSDQSCLEAWAKNRSRFLGLPRPSRSLPPLAPSKIPSEPSPQSGSTTMPDVATPEGF